MKILEPVHRKKTVIIGDSITWFHDNLGHLRRLPVTMVKSETPTAFDSLTEIQSYKLPNHAIMDVKEGDKVAVKSKLAHGVLFINKIFYIDMSKLILSLVFIGIGVIVYVASRKRGLKY